MTPNNIVNMAVLKGLEVIALTDHNTSKNCPAFVAAAGAAGLSVLCGMELNCAEEIHAVCLFPTLEAALEFDAYVSARLPNLANKTEIFGEQRILDEQDHIIGYEPKLLINATEISIMEAPELVRRYGGVCFPAHIDRSSYSILSSLGMVPPECGFTAYEIKDVTKTQSLLPLLPNKNAILLHDSDAHYLWDIAEPEYSAPGPDILSWLAGR